MHDEEELVRRALQAGAIGYVLKSDSERNLQTAIEAVSQGRRFVSPSVSKILLNRRAVRLPSTVQQMFAASITQREREIMQLLAEGMTNKQVAHLLSISVRTAENHRAHLMKKLNLTSLSGLVRYALRNHIIQT